MEASNRFLSIGTLAAALCLLAWVSVAPVQSQTGSEGNNAVFKSGTAVSGSAAFIDASVFANTTTSTNICETIYNILNSPSYLHGTTVPGGEVIDARGLTNTSGGNSNFLTCKSSPIETPWLMGTTYLPYPSVILLPAGTITISYTWLLPNNTRIIGQGASVPVTSGTQTGTVLSAASGFTGPASSISPVLAMIQFGDPPGPSNPACSKTGICFNISLEDLTLSNVLHSGGVANSSIDGILNMDSQELTYVRRVNLYGITGTGLQIDYPGYPYQAQNSGPYESISYTVPTGITGKYCAQIYGAGMRGIHGMKCIGNSGTAGILLDAESTSIEDVYVNGFTDGILVGSQSSGSSLPWGNLLSNISGGNGVTNLIHICGTSTCTPSGMSVPRDITILSATSSANTTILDGVAGATLFNSTDATVGMYALGESVPITSTVSGNSRFTTSPSIPTWFVGSAAPTGTGCSAGSIFTATSGSQTLWACLSNGTGTTWINEK